MGRLGRSKLILKNIKDSTITKRKAPGPKQAGVSSWVELMKKRDKLRRKSTSKEKAHPLLVAFFRVLEDGKRNKDKLREI